MTVLLVGGGGVLGSGFREVLERRGEDVVRLHVDWTRVDGLTDALRPHLRSGAVLLVWAAGVGGVGASAAAMAAESRGLELVAQGVREMPLAAAHALSFVFASSAGAVHAGHGPQPVHEGSPTSATSAYGEVKLAQEALLRELSADVGCRVLACRYSNVYGLASGRLTARGLVSTAVRATRHRQPMTVYVDPDTRRDYVYAPDAATQSLALVDSAPSGFSTALVCDGEVRTVAGVISLVGHVSGRRVPVAYAERPATRLQPRVLRFAPRRTPGVRTTPMEAAVHRMMRAPVA